MIKKTKKQTYETTTPKWAPEDDSIVLGQLSNSWEAGELKKYLADQTNNFKGKKRYDFLYSVMSAAKNLYNDED